MVMRNRFKQFMWDQGTTGVHAVIGVTQYFNVKIRQVS